ncbi:MAG: hypothetical protein WCL21_14645 [Mariniphaga sp.]
MNKKLNSLAWSLAFVLIYVYATYGITRLIWKTKDLCLLEDRTKFLGYMLIVFSLVYIIAIYHIVGPHRVDWFYQVFILFHVIYLILGCLVNLFAKKRE